MTAPTFDLDDIHNDWEWGRAEVFYRAGDPAKLVALLRSDKPIPPTQRALLADIAKGRAATRKRRNNAKLTFDELAALDRAWTSVVRYFELIRREALR